MPSLMQKMLETKHEDLPMGVKHEVIREASFYLDLIMHEGIIPELDDYVVVPNMHYWCYITAAFEERTDKRYPDRKEVQACLAGIWYIASTNKVMLDLKYALPTRNILMYLDQLATCTNPQLHGLVGLEEVVPRIPEYDGWNPTFVQKRLHNLAHLIPTMRDSYIEASNSMGYYKGIPGGLSTSGYRQ